LGNVSETKVKPFMCTSHLTDIVESLAMDPRYKMMKVISTPEVNEESLAFTNNNWLSLMKRGYLMLNNGSNEAMINWSEQNRLRLKAFLPIYRGRNLSEVDEADGMFHDLAIKHGINGLVQKFDKNEINNYEKHMTILSNSSFFSEDIGKTIKKASDMLSHDAFMHQYEKYDMERTDFLDAIAFCEQIKFDYNN
jgi:hypothetical protein